MRKSTERPQVYDVGSSVKFDPAEPESYPAAECSASWNRSVAEVGHTNSATGESSERIAEDLHRRLVVQNDFSVTGRSTITCPSSGPFAGTVCSALSPQAHADGSVRGQRLGVGLAVALSYAFGIAPFESTARAVLRVEMEVSDGARSEVYLNGRVPTPLAVSLEPGVRRIYAFAFGREDLKSIRLDPTGTSLRQSQGFCEDRGWSIRTRSLVDQQAGTWNKSGVQPLDDSASFAFESITADPIVHASTSVQMTDVPWWRERLDPQGSTLRVAGLAVRPTTFGGGPASTRAVARRRANDRAGGHDCAHRRSHAVHRRCEPRMETVSAPLGVAASRASFLGPPVLVDQLVSVAGLGLAIALAASAAWSVRVRRAPSPDNVLLQAKPVGGGVLIAWWIVLVVAFAPDLARALDGFGSQAYRPHWDANNLVYWAYLAGAGAISPFRDYWYPYAGQYLFELAWPLGPLVRWSFEVLVFGACTTSLWLLARERRAWVLVVGAVLVATDRTLGRAGLMGMERYLLSINVLLAYVAICRAPPFRLGPVLTGRPCHGLGSRLRAGPTRLRHAGVARIWLVEIALERPRTINAFRAQLRVPALFAGLDLL